MEIIRVKRLYVIAKCTIELLDWSDQTDYFNVRHKVLGTSSEVLGKEYSRHCLLLLIESPVLTRFRNSWPQLTTLLAVKREVRETLSREARLI